MTVPLFVSRRRLMDRKTLPRATCDWSLDSGGFSELSLHGGWSITPKEYVAEVRRYREEIGRLLWMPTMDWMCEPHMTERTGLCVESHQRRTTESYLTLREMAPDLPWVPVLQGWEADDYLRHRQQYADVGVDLEALPLVGLGSVCRRQHTLEAERIVRSLKGLKLHGFGVKLTGLERFSDALTSADSLAWSIHARNRKPMLPGCTHRSCSSCRLWALKWRESVVARVRTADKTPRQLALW